MGGMTVIDVGVFPNLNGQLEKILGSGKHGFSLAPKYCPDKKLNLILGADLMNVGRIYTDTSLFVRRQCRLIKRGAE